MPHYNIGFGVQCFSSMLSDRKINQNLKFFYVIFMPELVFYVLQFVYLNNIKCISSIVKFYGVDLFFSFGHLHRFFFVEHKRSTTISSKLQASQLRSQPSQQSFSNGLSSQPVMLSQFSQNSLDEVVTNEQVKFCFLNMQQTLFEL